ncbi:MAG: hypothetical protein HFI71_05430 [Lachnospiraceae bacterium]|nr:hypothetical protein [Lachnospiraceae bacterium]
MRKIAFIICVNDECYYQECLFYIERLHLPQGVELEVYPVRAATSMCQGYQQAMQQTDAEYKVYMHQDVFLINRDFLLHMLKLFEDHPKAGLVGVLGARQISLERRFYRSWDIGNVFGCNEKRAFHNELCKKEQRAAVLDGMLLMTRVDIPWREEWLSGWDFYDISKSLEYQREGYEVWIPAQDQPWCIHDCGYLNLVDYDRAQEEFLRAYGEILPDYSGQPLVYPPSNRERFALMMELKEQWKSLLFLGHIQELSDMFQKLEDERFFDTEMAILKNILEIIAEESAAQLPVEQGFLYDCGSFAQAYQKYLQVKFWLRRNKYAPDCLGNCPDISIMARQIITKHTMLV